MSEKTFSVDFFDFCFLVEACIPPRPIARTYFWYRVIDTYYHQMTEEERARLLDWISKHPSFNKENEDVLMFYDRFSEETQYTVETLNGKSTNKTHCFLHNGKYHTSRNSWICEKYITNIYKTYDKTN